MNKQQNIEQFLYGDKGIYETAQYDENLETLFECPCKFLITTREDYSDYGYEQIHIHPMENEEELLVAKVLYGECIKPRKGSLQSPWSKAVERQSMGAWRTRRIQQEKAEAAL